MFTKITGINKKKYVYMYEEFSKGWNKTPSAACVNLLNLLTQGVKELKGDIFLF